MAVQLIFANFVLDKAARELRRDGEIVRIEPRTFDLLVFLAENNNRAVGKDELQNEVWGTIVSDGALSRAAMKLRKALGDNAEAIVKTVPRFGYRFTAEVMRHNVGVVEQATETIASIKNMPPRNRRSRHIQTVAGVLFVSAIAIMVWRTVMDDEKPGPGNGISLVSASTFEKSIAVLPFDDLSETQDQLWIADGLTQEILNSLTRTPDLLVASGTSSSVYRDSRQDIASIARTLGVKHVLDGSIRRAGERIRVTAQLIRAGDGIQLWSDSYDRSKGDLIDIQESVAIEIARALQTAMDPESLQMMLSVGTKSIAAFEAYLKGVATNSNMVATGDVDEFLTSLSFFQQAVNIDPEFSAAHWQVADFWGIQLISTNIASQNSKYTHDEILGFYRESMSNAIQYERDPISSISYRAQDAHFQLKYRQSLRLNSEFLALRPFDHDAQVLQLDLLREMNMFEDAANSALEFFDRDGYDPVVTARSLLAITYAGDADTTREFIARSMNRFSNTVIVLYQIHRALLWIGEVEQAKEISSIIQSSELPASIRHLAALRQYCGEQRYEEAEKLHTSANKFYADSQLTLWMGEIIMGDDLKARDVLMHLDNRDDLGQLGGYLQYVFFDPTHYPVLMRHLETQGNEPGDRVSLPYRCGQ